MGSEDLIALARVDYHQAKELFAINVTGCSLWDILSTLLIVPLLCAIYQEVCILLFSTHLYSKCPKWLLNGFHFVLEYFIFVIPILLVCTIWTERKWTFCVLGITGLLLHLLNSIIPKDESFERNSSIILTVGGIDSKYKGYLTAFRSIIVLFTCVCILAVDFQVFPRKYAKTYLTGFSLMDIGVGLYIVSGGIVAPMKKQSLQSVFKKQLVLLVLGIVRWVFIRVSGYVSNPLEYGKDWNFFFTLFIVHFVCFVILEFITNPYYIMLAGAIVTAYYQGLLSLGLSSFIRENKEKTFVALNAPGIFSCFGFIGLFLLAAGVGSFLHQSKNNRGISLIALTALIGGCYWITGKIEPASRRSGNANYVCLVMLIALIILSVAYHLNVWYKKYYAPLILKSFNDNQLLVFMGANVFTGVINLVVKTMLVSDISSMTILVLYMFVLSVIGCFIGKSHSFVCFCNVLFSISSYICFYHLTLVVSIN